VLGIAVVVSVSVHNSSSKLCVHYTTRDQPKEGNEVIKWIKSKQCLFIKQ